MRIGGIARKYIIPENIEDLLLAIKENPVHRIISGGSNILINDRAAFDTVIYLGEFNKRIKKIDNNTFYIGASNKISSVVKHINSEGLGGLEMLYGIPATIGGAIYMNAGYGKEPESSIGYYIESIDVLDDGKIVSIPSSECNFSYRYSMFQNNKSLIIIGARMKFPSMRRNQIEERINKRIAINKALLNGSKYSLGSIFNKFNGRLMYALFRIGKMGKGRCKYSHLNVITNTGNATFQDVRKLIDITIFLHKLFRAKISLEIEIWE